jgi:hypothetical protein
VIAQTGHPPILYSTTDWLATCTGNSAALGQDPLWIAHYTTAAGLAPLPANWTGWGIWQYASNGTVKGIPTSNATDLDQLNLASFQDPGHLIVFNPGSQKGVAGTVLAAPVNVNAYPEEQNPALAFSQVVLPPGLTLNPATGQITGTLPPSAAAYPADVTVTDATSGASGSVSFTWYASGHLTVTSPGNQSRSAGSPVGLQVKAADSVPAPPITFAATGLPPGLSITTGGLITGWPDTPGTYHATVTATDSLQASALAAFTWTVSAAAGTGPTGPVKLDLGGKCLNDVGNRSANGTLASIWSCSTSSSAQKWTHAPDGTLRIHGNAWPTPAPARRTARQWWCGHVTASPTRRGRCPPGRWPPRSRACAWTTVATAPPTAPRSTCGRVAPPQPSSGPPGPAAPCGCTASAWRSVAARQPAAPRLISGPVTAAEPSSGS